MVSDFLRRTSRPVLQSLARGLARLGFSPNLLTLIGLLLNVGVGVLLALGHLRLGGALVLLVSLFDSLDGAVARYTNRVTKFGAFLDSTIDRYEEAALFCGLMWYFATIGLRQEVVLTGVALFGSLAVSYTRARAEGLGIECKVGLFTRVERIVVLALGLILGLPLITLWVLAVLTHFTALQRIWHVRRVTTDAHR